MNAADRRQINQARNARDRALDAIHETRQALARAEQADDMVERIVLEYPQLAADLRSRLNGREGEYVPAGDVVAGDVVEVNGVEVTVGYVNEGLWIRQGGPNGSVWGGQTAAPPLVWWHGSPKNVILSRHEKVRMVFRAPEPVQPALNPYVPANVNRFDPEDCEACAEAENWPCCYHEGVFAGAAEAIAATHRAVEQVDV